MDFVILQQLVVSLGLGLLLGLERERSEPSIAGIRTFPLISLMGTVCAQIALAFGGWIVAAGWLALAAVVVFANLAKQRQGDNDPGITTEVAALLLYGVGVLLVVGSLGAAIVVGGAMAVLLHLKEPMHRFAAAVGENDMRAMMQFVVVSLIILPVLPNQEMGPSGVWNPFKIWLMVVFIVGISLGGYVAYKLFGAKAGTILGGIIGGLISSTATTVSFARRCASQGELAPLGAFVIMIAACISLVRVLLEVAAVAPGAFGEMAPPLFAMWVGCVGISGLLYWGTSGQHLPMPAQSNPAELKSALVFGGLYALILWAVAVAKIHLGSTGLYVVAVISGLTDMDAITLSTAGMVTAGSLESAMAWRLIMVAALANFAFKWAMVAVLGSQSLTRRVTVAFAGAALCGGLILLLWPAGRMG